MAVPVVAASGCKSDVRNRDVQAFVFRQAGEVGFAAEVFRIRGVFLSDGEVADARHAVFILSDEGENFTDLLERF